MKLNFVGIIFLLLLTKGCWNEKPITITKDYVINPNWKKEFDDGNGLAVYKMKLKDSSKFIDPKDPTEQELYHGLIEDKNFKFRANVKYNGTDYSKRKVYFDRYNGFLWCDLNNIHSDCERRILGKLEQETWYLLAGLSQFKTLYYIYLDVSDILHVHTVSGMTNY